MVKPLWKTVWQFQNKFKHGIIIEHRNSTPKKKKMQLHKRAGGLLQVVKCLPELENLQTLKARSSVLKTDLGDMPTKQFMIYDFILIEKAF
jgi:hypothetical protein